MPSSKTSDDQRIAKLLARAGIASRREVERMIAEGRVALNGAIIETPATILKSLDGITVDGNPVADLEPARLFLYNKPSGLLVTERDPAGRPTIYDRLPKGLPRLVPVGRLDLNTEGLLLLTTDGELKRQLELPATGVERAYRARAYGTVSQTQLEDLIEGVEIEGVRYGKIDANLERRTGANVWIEMILTEGKNREVRRVLEYLGLQVSRLIRTRYGPFVLGDLPMGGIGEVRAHDIDSFRKDPTRIDLPQAAKRQVEAVRREDMPRGPRRGAGRMQPPGEARPLRHEDTTKLKHHARPPRDDSRPPRREEARRDESPRPPRRDDAPRVQRDAAPSAGSQRPGRPGRPAKQPRQRADGSLAVKASASSPARAARARTFRDDRGPAPAKPSGTPRSKGPAGGRGKSGGGSRPPRSRK
jgi:23S rRNA pseudouridine2605 synthase